jgi:hypothetical protein
MAYELALFTQALDRVLGEEKSREFSLTMLIGVKLRALYNEAEQPCPSRLAELLRALDEATEPRSSSTTSPPIIGRRPQTAGPHPRADTGIFAGNL